MSLFGDSQFFAAAGVLAAVAVIMGLREVNIRHYGFAVSIFFTFMAMKDSPAALMWCAVYLATQYIIVRAYLETVKRFGVNEKIYAACMVLSLAMLAVYKLTEAAGSTVCGFIGISYMTFKVLQIIIETHDGMIKEIRAFDFFYLMLFFPCLLAGPIDRSLRFNSDLEAHIPRSEYVGLLGSGLVRIVMGAAYKFALSGVFYYLTEQIVYRSGFLAEAGYMYSYGFYMFFDFAGYSLMATGMAYLFGIRCPDNFNKPFISTDMNDFWNRWHMTLSYWFRDYLFSRLVRKLMRSGRFSSKLTLSGVAFIVNMGVMGVWHGLDSCYIIYGLYHGVLLALTKIYQKKSKLHKKYKKKKPYKLLSWFVTFNLVMFGFYIFSGRLGVLFELLQNILN